MESHLLLFSLWLFAYLPDAVKPNKSCAEEKNQFSHGYLSKWQVQYDCILMKVLMQRSKDKILLTYCKLSALTADLTGLITSHIMLLLYAHTRVILFIYLVISRIVY